MSSCGSNFGHSEGLKVGDCWQTRQDCSAAGVHVPSTEALHFESGVGCYSILLFNTYLVASDYGDGFTYIVTDKVKAAALIINKMYKLSMRVVRGDKLKSEFAPRDGYRYDGLYLVTRYWRCRDESSGCKLFVFHFDRLPHQSPPPWGSGPNSSNCSPKSILKKCSLINQNPSPKCVRISNHVLRHVFFNDLPNEDNVDMRHSQETMKQMTISDYFLPLDSKSHLDTTLAAPKSLRGNRLPPMIEHHTQETVPADHHNHNATKNEYPSKRKSRKYPPRWKHTAGLSQTSMSPSWMETLIERHSEELRRAKKLSEMQIMPCQVKLTRLEAGFTDEQICSGQLNCLRFIMRLQNYCSLIEEDGFRGFQSLK